MSRFAIVCNTPFQVLNAVNLINSGKFDADYDLYLQGDFRNSDSVFYNLKKSNFFENVFFWKTNKEAKISKIRTFIKFINSKLILSEYITGDYSFIGKKYDKIFVGDGNTIGIYLSMNNRKSDIYFYDDGISTNIGNCLFDGQSISYKLIGKLLKLGVYRYRVEKLFVNNLDFCKSTLTKNIEKLPNLDFSNNVIDIVKELFSYNEESLIEKKNIIYLGQPLEEKKGYNGKCPLFFIDELSGYSENILVRAHPRQKTEDFLGMEIDKINNLWELECITKIQDYHVLMGFCSTAQLMPKLLSNKEPYVIFLFNLFLDDYNTNEYNNDYYSYESLKNMYSSKEKVFLPSTVEELKNILETIMSLEEKRENK